MESRKLTCQEAVELVTEYLEGSLSEHDHRRLEDHLASCQGCTNYVQQMRQAIRLIGELNAGIIAPDAREELLTIFRDWKAL